MAAAATVVSVAAVTVTIAAVVAVAVVVAVPFTKPTASRAMCVGRLCQLSRLLLQVRDGRSETDPLIGRYCGSSLPAPVLSSSNFLWIRFKSDSSVSHAGFRAVYSVGTVCLSVCL